MEKWKNKKVIRGVIIGFIVVITAGVVVVNTKITPADSVNQSHTVAEKSQETNEKSRKEETTKKETSQKSSETVGQEDAASSTEPSQDGAASGGELSPGDGNPTSQVVTAEQETSPQKENTREESQQEETPPKPGGTVAEPVKNITCSVSISCHAISGNGLLTANGHPEVEAYAANPTILAATSYSVQEGTTAFDLLQQACNANGIPLDAEYTQAYGTYYVKGINYLYELYAGFGSGWMYQVNGVSPNLGASSYKLSEGDVVTWYYVTK